MNSGAPEVVLRRLSGARATLGVLRAVLTDAERAEAARFLRAEDRDRFALARGTLRELAGRALGLAPQSVAIARDPLGKLKLIDAPELACNVSHSGDVVAVALGSAREIGVDVEAHRTNFDLVAVAATFMTAGERAAMANAACVETFFFRQWCFKEAQVKALGTGLTRDPKRFEILFEASRARPRFLGPGADDLGEGWRLSPLAVGEGYSGALVWR